MVRLVLESDGISFAAVLKLEEHFLQYERLGGSKLSSGMKPAVLLRAVSGQMKVLPNFMLNEGSSYQTI